MANNNNLIPIPGRMHCVATEGVGLGADEIFDDAKGKRQSVINQETDASLDNKYDKDETYSKQELNNLITTPNQEYVTLSAQSGDTLSDIFNGVTGSADTTYRVGNWNGSQYDVTAYSEYSFDGTNFIHLSTKTQVGEVFDISAYKATGGTLATFDDLADALDSGNNVPSGLRKGGMSVKYVQSSDNNYVQFLCTADEFTTDVTCWQKLNNKELTIKVNDLLNHIQDFDSDELNITDSEGNVILKVSRDGLQSVKFIDKDGNDILDNIQTVIDTLLKYFQNLNGECLYVTDNDGNIIFKISDSGAESVDFQANKRKLSEAPLGWYGNTLYVSDNDGNVIFSINSDGIHCTKIFANAFSIPGIQNDWADKIVATYGDSVTAVNNGDFQKPFPNLNTNWGNKVASYFNMAKHYGRGIGGQGYSWATGVGDAGGSVSWVTPTGVFINRLDSFNYDNWDGETYPSGVTAEMEQQGTAIRVRGCLSSWLRITKMFPASIKDTIDVVLVMAHNDGYDNTPCSFVANDTTDTEWANSGNDYYGKINGDYNINTFKGGVASTLMKLQLWMPNAVIVLMTGVSGQGATGELNLDINYSGGLNKAQAIREMSKLTSIPCIDTYASDGINGWNRTYYIEDNIHPNSTKGRNMLSRPIIGGLKTILPKESIIY